MAKSITIRNVPDEVRDEIARRAANHGQSLQAFLRGMLVDKVSYPDPDEHIARVRARVKASGVNVGAEDIVAMIRAHRDA